jgi:two-component system, OmpR family, phosphate regulon sensor histidine kinase PhoR
MGNSNTEFFWLDALPDGAIVVATNGMVDAVNLQAKEILQTDPTGLPIMSVIRSPAFKESLQQVAELGLTASVDVEFQSRPVRQVNAHLARFGDKEKTLIVLRDLTREQAIEKMRSDFVANASHEMRTPLATIIGSIETLQGAAKNDAAAREKFLASMLVQGNRMKALIDDLLTLSRIELNEHVRPNGKVVLLNVLRQAKANLAQQASDYKVVVEISGEANVIVAGEADELLQIAQNLLENALKYGASGGRVDLRCESSDGKGIFTVKDFGKGISEIHLPRLTERFYRVSTQESRQRGGTGLGLAIVKHIVLRHRGQLDIRSELEQGSTFSVAIPLYNSTT